MVITRDMLRRVNRLLGLFKPPEISTVGSLDTIPTEKDKPSNHSSHDKMKKYRELYYDYPARKGYQVSLVANTNSMEPMFDSNCIIILENVQGKWSKRLQEEPFSKGDVVTYLTNVGSIIHELKEKTTWLGRPAWLLQGLNNKLPDMSKVKEDIITHRVCGIWYCKKERDGD